MSDNIFEFEGKEICLTDLRLSHDPIKQIFDFMESLGIKDTEDPRALELATKLRQALEPK